MPPWTENEFKVSVVSDLLFKLLETLRNDFLQWFFWDRTLPSGAKSGYSGYAKFNVIFTAIVAFDPVSLHNRLLFTVSQNFRER